MVCGYVIKNMNKKGKSLKCLMDELLVKSGEGQQIKEAKRRGIVNLHSND